MAVKHVSLFYPDQVVAPIAALLCVQAPDGGLVLCESLGPGLVQQVARDGRVWVRWVGAGFEMWIEPDHLQLPRPYARLISISRVDRRGNTRLLRHKVVEEAGLEHNWSVELHPTNMVRTVRGDGAAWTFRFIPILRHLVTTAWSVPPEDEDAEAFMVAEVALLTVPRR